MPFSCCTVKRRDSFDKCLLFHSLFLHLFLLLLFFSHVLINSLLSHHVFQMSSVILCLGVIFVANKWRLSMHCLVISWRNSARLQHFWPWFVLVWFRELERKKRTHTQRVRGERRSKIERTREEARPERSDSLLREHKLRCRTAEYAAWPLMPD